nr:Transthyretin domain containing protein [Haemonchus contortus]
MKQSIGIRGVLRCGSKPLRDHAVKLYVSKIAPFSDVLVATNRTDSNGLFYLIGTTARIPLMTQYLVVENDCSGKEQKVELPSSLEELSSSKVSYHIKIF